MQTSQLTAPLLIEIGCEELPPKSLDILAESLFDSVCAGFEKSRLGFNTNSSRWYATPRRLAVLLADVESRQSDQVVKRRGPAVQAAFADDGAATPAALGFARSVGAAVEDLQRIEEGGREYLYFESMQTGKTLGEMLFPILEQAASQLPVPKPMRWSDHSYQFVRPVHWLVVLHGNDVLQGELFGHPAGRLTLGHRVHAPGTHEIPAASGYEAALYALHVMVAPELRREKISTQAASIGESASAFTSIDTDLLDEVKNLVEWPVCLAGQFEKEFLDVPTEALVSSMQSHQKFFPLYKDASMEQLLNRFVTVANLESTDPGAVVEGFERVIRPRLSDARFFWQQDKNQPLFESRGTLDDIIFQKQLGTIGDKCNRVAALCGNIAADIDFPAGPVSQAAQLAKCDLVSNMVGEFPELQGVMGRYYALASGEDADVAQAIEEHYWPRFAGDKLPATITGQILALADRLDTLVGIFSIGQKPTGTKDPFALRRAAQGCVRLLQIEGLSLSLDRLISFTAAGFEGVVGSNTQVQQEVKLFILERLRNLCREQGYSAELVNAVTDVQDDNLVDFSARLSALKIFSELPEADSLAAANKRISNILRKSAAEESFSVDDINAQLPEEKGLLSGLTAISESVRALSAAGNYAVALDQLAGLKPSVDAFFDQVMVMDDDPIVRRSRLALVAEVQNLFRNIANISALA